jgi:hypothetical protein
MYLVWISSFAKCQLSLIIAHVLLKILLPDPEVCVFLYPIKGLALPKYIDYSFQHIAKVIFLM